MRVVVAGGRDVPGCGIEAGTLHVIVLAVRAFTPSASVTSTGTAPVPPSARAPAPHIGSTAAATPSTSTPSTAGCSVAITMSAPPTAFVEVPNLIGLTLADAQASLEQRGLATGAVSGNGDRVGD